MPITLYLEPNELYDEETNRFIKTNGGWFTFEHSLLAISKWEIKFQKPFFTTTLEGESLLYYIQCMTEDNLEIEDITHDLIDALVKYMNDKQTATRINSNNKSSNRVMTSEVIYAYMALSQIPYHCEKWNINRLMILLTVVGELQEPPKKKSQKDILMENKRLNDQRLKEMAERSRGNNDK